jgi:hypothetical protein
MKLVHYSSKPLQTLRAGRLDHPELSLKPDGLWVSDDNCEMNWRAWCIGANFGLDSLTHVHDVTLRDDANVRVITSVAELDAFHAEYRLPGLPDFALGFDWARVMQAYDGVIITPYLWQRRLDGSSRWYYGWDCASGCLWNPAVISVSLREVVPVPE